MPTSSIDSLDPRWMHRALSLAKRALGKTSPNPVVGAVLTRGERIIGEGYHHRAGQPHAEIEALKDCQQRGENPRKATLWVTLEPCSTHGRTPPCTEAILQAGIRHVVVAATDPNPAHAGRGLELLRKAGVQVTAGLLAQEAEALNAGFNQWIVHRSPLITLKAGMTLDGKIATASGESRWITGEASRREVMRLRQEHDAILVGVNTVKQDDPQLTIRRGKRVLCKTRIVLDTHARIPWKSRLLQDEFREQTWVVVGENASAKRIQKLQTQVHVLVAPEEGGHISLPWLCRELGQRQITSVLVEGGGEIHASFLEKGQAHRVAFFYAPKILGGRDAIRAVGGQGFQTLESAPRLTEVKYRTLGDDLLLTGRITTAA